MIHHSDVQALKSVDTTFQFNPLQVYHSKDSLMPIVIDTGSSVSITPNKADFIEPIGHCSLRSLQGLMVWEQLNDNTRPVGNYSDHTNESLLCSKSISQTIFSTSDVQTV